MKRFYVLSIHKLLALHVLTCCFRKELSYGYFINFYSNGTSLWKKQIKTRTHIFNFKAIINYLRLTLSCLYESIILEFYWLWVLLLFSHKIIQLALIKHNSPKVELKSWKFVQVFGLCYICLLFAFCLIFFHVPREFFLNGWVSLWIKILFMMNTPWHYGVESKARRG